MRDPRAAVNVPVNYVFRPVPATWTLGEARVVAWTAIHLKKIEERERAAGLFVPPPLLLPSINDNQRTPPILRLEITGPGYLPDSSFVDVERDFVPAGLLPLSATPENSPEIKSECFPVLVDREIPLPEESGFILQNTPAQVVHPERNPWRLRKEFFALQEDDNDALLSFLRKWGVWGFHDSFHKALFQHLYRPQDFWKFRDLLRSKAILSPKKWLENASPLPVWSSENHPVYTLTRSSIVNALEDTITLEKMKQTEHAICARKGCGNIIAKTGKRPKKFCDESCALKVRQQRFWSARRRTHA